jgi:hypothetical protein
MSTLAFVVVALVAAALATSVAVARLRALATQRRVERRERRQRRRAPRVDPGTERRAERRARALLRSIVNRDEWEMYRDLGFIRVIGRNAVDGTGTGAYCYLIYAHKPIVAYLPGSNSLMSEYCVESGRQVDPQQVRRDLWRLKVWERDRHARREQGAKHAAVGA